VSRREEHPAAVEASGFIAGLGSWV